MSLLLRRKSFSSVVVAALGTCLMVAACDETIEATPATDAGTTPDGSTDGTAATDGTTSNDGSQSDGNTGTDATTDTGTDTGTDATSDATSDVTTDGGTDAAADVDAGPAFCVANPIDANESQAIAINFIIELQSRCQLGGFVRTDMVPVEDCLGVFLRDRIGCAGANYATALDTGNNACAGFFVHPLDGASFTNADFDQAMVALGAALDVTSDELGIYTDAGVRAAFLAKLEQSRSTVVKSAAAGLSHSICDAGDGG